MRRSTTYFIHNDGGTNAYAYRGRVGDAIDSAERMVIDHGATRAIVMRYQTGSDREHGHYKQAGVFTGAFWVQVTDDRLRRALDAREQ